MNWISPIGLSPCAAMPTHRPPISVSASGVSITRSRPKRCWSPTVARKTPPLTPMSSPSNTTLESSPMARASATLMASTNVISGMECPLDLVALAPIGIREFGVEMIEHGFRGPRAHRQIAGDPRLYPLLALSSELLFLRFAPCLLADQIRPQPRDRLLLPMRLDFLGRTVSCRIIRCRVVSEPVSHGLDEGGTFAAARSRNGLLGQRRGCGLQPEWDRNRPLIIVGDEHDGKTPHTCKIHRFPDIALRGGAVTEQAHRDPRLPSELECISNPYGVRRLGSHRNAAGEVVSRPGRQIAALIASPKQQQLLHLHPAPEKRSIVAIGGQQNVIRQHGAGNPDSDALLAQCYRIGAEPPGALERDRFQVEGASQHHRAIQSDEKVGVGGESRQ